MTKFMNIVRCKVKLSGREEYLKKIDDMPKFEGQISAKYVETKPNEFFMIGEWNSEDDIAKARPKMIAFLDTLRHFRRATDPHSGTVVIEELYIMGNILRFRSNRKAVVEKPLHTMDTDFCVNLPREN